MTHLVGGISSAARNVAALDGTPFRVERSAGPFLWDDRGRRYVDYCMGFGATMLGHAPPEVVEATIAALRAGPSPALPHAREEEAAAALARLAPTLPKAIFVNSGSEAVHLACRAARILTGRRRIAKFAAAYDGWYDDVLFGNAGSAEAALGENRRPAQERTTLLRYNDPGDTEQLFRDHDDIAAVLIEPVLANAGCVLPKPGYLEHLQRVARAHGAMVILDEVLMGLRLGFGLTGIFLGVDPDFAALGKAIGSGIPVAALIGKPEPMAAFEAGRIGRAGTYSGNPLATAAVTASIAVLERADFPAMIARGERLRQGITAAGRAAGLPLVTSGYGSVFTPWFAERAPTDYAEAAQRIRPDLSQALHEGLRRHGVMVMPMPYGRLFFSFAHDDAAVDATLAGFAAVLPELARRY